ncbi:hypothetical protein [Pyruvatibacter sp.]|uniref:hypothetical protein n=1 Tax=Pyruvatibacter sp. TaxID=1981328 RepID=UPI0032EC50AC
MEKQPEDQLDLRTQWKIAGTFFGIFVVIFLAWALGIFSSEPTKAERDAAAYRGDCENQITGLVAAQGFVRDTLRAPATAEFGVLGYDGVAVTVLPDCRYSVRSFVDSQNGFGAMIRTRFDATVSLDRDRSIWTLESLELAER